MTGAAASSILILVAKMWVVMIAVPAVLFAGSHWITQCTALRGADLLQTTVALTPITLDEAAPFLGAWTSTMEGPAGPINFRIALNMEDGKVVATVSSDLISERRVRDITKTEKGISLRYTAELWGYSAPLVMTLAPERDELQANVLVMQGQFQLSGMATRQPGTYDHPGALKRDP
jgi:hypothetical protein